MRVLVDTNVILRFTQNVNPGHAVARSALTQLSTSGHELCLVPQSIYEYWVVATRPVAVNGFGMLVADADQQYRNYYSTSRCFGMSEAFIHDGMTSSSHIMFRGNRLTTPDSWPQWSDTA